MAKLAKRMAKNGEGIDRQKFYGLDEAVKLIINGYCDEVFKQLPMEFALEANRLLELKLEGSVG